MKRVVLFFIAVAFTLTGCLKELRRDVFSENSLSSVIDIHVKMPVGYEYSPDDVNLILSDPVSGLQFFGKTDINGKATVRVAHGTYNATAVVKHAEPGGIIYIFNGSASKIMVTPNDPDLRVVTIPLNASKTSQIIIKEAYY